MEGRQKEAKEPWELNAIPNSKLDHFGLRGSVGPWQDWKVFWELDGGNVSMGFPGGSAAKESTCNAGDPG